MNPTIKVKSSNIKYASDGEDVSDLPNELTFEFSDESDIDEENLADLISEETGFLVESFNYEIV